MQRFIDKATIGQVKNTEAGYLTAVSRAARTGVQLYRASEIGDVAIKAGFKDADLVRVNRPESEVFSKDAMSSLIHAPVTIDHPPAMVDAGNWGQYAVGEVGSDVMRDGESLVLSLIVKDAAAIEKTRTTHKELSLGYYAKIVPAMDKSVADFDMVDFKFNHISAVPRGRAGSEYRIGDADAWGASPIVNKEEPKMTELKTVILGDKAVSVEAKDADTVATILKDHDTAIKALQAQLAVKDARVKELEEKEVDEDDLDELVEKRIESKRKRKVVDAKLGDAAKDFTDAQIDVAYVIIDGLPDNGVRDAISKKPVTDGANDPIAAWDTFYSKGKK